MKNTTKPPRRSQYSFAQQPARLPEEKEVSLPKPSSLPSQDFSVYLAPRNFEADLLVELGPRVLAQYGRLIFAGGGAEATAPPCAWAQNIWRNPQWIGIDSIGDGVKKLKELQRNWHLHSTDHHRRARLMEEQLPKVSRKAHIFGAPAPTAPLGAWTLWEPNLLLAATDTASPYADGELLFEENKVDPPGRAYLKLWEVFTLLGVQPKAGELCLDLGASPGGWTWVLGQLGAQVFSIDKAELAPQVAALPTVSHCMGSGFGLDPRHAGAVDWLFSDMICYPDRLLEMIRRWLDVGQCRNYVCTLKFQAETDHETARAFAAIPGSQLLHLSCNKHELTWVLLGT